MGREKKTRKRNRRENDFRRRMKFFDRKDDIPNCPSLESLDSPNKDLPKTDDVELESQIASESNGNSVLHGFTQPVYQSNVREENQINRPLIDTEKLGPILETVGQVALEMFLQLCNMIKYAVQYPTPFAMVFVIVGLYMTVLYLEMSLAASIDIIVGILWPPIHMFLRSGEGLFDGVGGWFGNVDELGQAAYCDMAASWCQKFKLMCHVQCSFTSFALERFRQGKR